MGFSPAEPLAHPLVQELETVWDVPLTYEDDTTMVEVALTDVFDLKKGDTKLTEEVMYNYIEPDGLPVYGGGESGARFHIARTARTGAGKPVTIFRGPAVILSLDGTSGAMRVIEEGEEFCLNHHGCVLTPVHPSIDLHWFVQQYEASLRAAASNKGSSATLTLTYVKQCMLQVPLPRTLRQAVGNLRRQLVALRRELFTPE